jgi:GAF domain-containing protein
MTKLRKVGFESNLIKTFEEVCKSACEMLGVDHSGFVRFDPLNEIGEVVAEYPRLDGLIGRKVKLKGISAEEELLTSERPLVKYDVANASDLGDVQALLAEYNICSICIVKVRFHGAVIGSFSFDSIGNLRNFTQEEIDFCCYFADLASKIIENAQFVNWMEAFQLAISAITTEHESESLLKVIIEQAEQLFSVSIVGLYLRGQNDAGDEILKHVASSENDLEGTILKRGEGMAWELILGDKSYLTTSDYDAYAKRAPTYQGRFGSVLEVPLLRTSEKIGVVYLGDIKGRIFTEFEANLLQRFADMVVIALQHCDLMARMRDLSIASAEITRSFESGNLEERLTKIATYATQILNAEMCGVFRIETPQYMTLEASVGHREGFFSKNQQFKIIDEPESGLTGAIAKRLIQWHAEQLERDKSDSTSTDKALVFNGCGALLLADDAVRRSPDASPAGTCHSLLAVPLITNTGKERVSGILRISNKKGSDGIPSPAICFNHQDEWILKIFAEAVVTALESAKLFDELKSQKDVYGQLLETWNTLASNDPLQTRLEKILQNLVKIIGKSFCRIALADESQEYLTFEAAAVHPRASGENLEWNADRRQPTRISEWPELTKAFQQGTSFELMRNGNGSNETLTKISALLNIRTQGSNRPLPIQSLLSVPMVVGGRTVGLLTVAEVRQSAERRSGYRGKERRSNPKVDFTTNQCNFASAVAAQATVMIDRDWRDQFSRRREELLSRLSVAVGLIRQEADGDKKLAVIAEQVRAIFPCQVGGLLIMSTSPGEIKVVIDSDQGLTDIENAQLGSSELTELLTSDRFIDDKAVSRRFSEVSGNLAELSPYELQTSIAVRFEYVAGSRCLLFCGGEKESCDLSFADVGLLSEFAKHCATSLTRAFMREQLTNARDGVNQIAKDLALSDHKYALQNVVNGIRAITDCDAVTLYTIRTVDNEIKAPPATVGLDDPQKAQKYVRPVLESPVGRVLKKNEIHTADDARADEVMAGGFVGREGIRSAAGIPVWLPDQSIAAGADSSGPTTTPKAVGVLFVNYKRRLHRFTADDINIIKMCAHLAAVAIRNQDLFNQERRKATVLKVLYDASKAISGTLELSEVLKHVAEKAFLVAQTLDRKVIHVAIKLFENGKAKVYAISPEQAETKMLIGEELEIAPVHGRIGIVGRAFKKQESQLVGNVSNDPDYRKLFPQTNSQIVALIGEGGPLGPPPTGAITIESEDHYAFDQDDLIAFQSLAALADDAIRNARQFSDRLYALEREANLKDLALYYVKCGILIHNQKGPVESIKRQSKLLDESPPREAVAKIVTDIADAARQLESISNLAEPSATQMVHMELHALAFEWEQRLARKARLARADVKGSCNGSKRRENSH